jgi:NAD(P)-dependent dehydrogenase (short-subunit alcohol dehydrogenase family)
VGGSGPRPTVLLTGPTSGIGAATLERLLSYPSRPDLLLLGRDPAALQRAVDRAHAQGLTARGIRIELADLHSVADACAEVTTLVAAGRSGPVDVAVLNAGLQMTDRRHTSAQGHELTFAVNVLAQHALLRGVEGLLSNRGHVVLMGSSTHRGRRASFGLVPDPQWQAPHILATADSAAQAPPGTREPGGIAYATSKLALVTLSHEWANRLGRADRRLNVYDPGLVAGTGLGRDMRPHEYWVWRRIMPAMSLLPGATTPARTARHLVSLALGDCHPRLHDGYVEMGRATHAEPATFDPARRRELWTWCEQALHFPARRQT